jgi:hypothetical protein
MKTHTLLFIAIALLGFCLRSPCYAQSTTVRGQLLHTDQSPAAGIQVLLLDESFNLSSPSTTNADRMYYFDNVPLGSYWLTVPFPRNEKRSPQTYRVQITHSPYEDLPRLTVAARIGAQSKSSGGVQQLKDAHLAFINHLRALKAGLRRGIRPASTKKWRTLRSNSRMRKLLCRRPCLRARNSSGIPLTSFGTMLHSSRSSIV